jgi:hypothetical protein
VKIPFCMVVVALATADIMAAKVTVTVSPGVAEVGQTALLFTVSATGTQFAETAVVFWNGSPRQTEPGWDTTRNATGTSLQVTLLPSDLSQTPKTTPQLTVVDASGLLRSVRLPVYPQCGAVVNSGTNALGHVVNVYSNGIDTTTLVSCGQKATAWHPVITSDYGEAYQCVELVRRYYDGLVSPQYSRLGKNSVWIGDASLYWTTYASKGLVNGSSTAPKKDDILVFQRTYTDVKGNIIKEGHVAIIVNIGSATVSILEENWDRNGGRPLPYDPVVNKISNPGSAFKVLGWLRSANPPQTQPVLVATTSFSGFDYYPCNHNHLIQTVTVASPFILTSVDVAGSEYNGGNAYGEPQYFNIASTSNTIVYASSTNFPNLYNGGLGGSGTIYTASGSTAPLIPSTFLVHYNPVPWCNFGVTFNTYGIPQP